MAIFADFFVRRSFNLTIFHIRPLPCIRRDRRVLLRGLGHSDLSANNRTFAKKDIVGKKLETEFAGMLEDYAHEVYRDGNGLPDIFEIDRLALLEDDLVLIVYINEADFEACDAVAIGHLAEVNELVVTHWILGGVDGLNNVYDAGHSGYAVKNHPVADN
jgi:hypothetical protein